MRAGTDRDGPVPVQRDKAGLAAFHGYLAVGDEGGERVRRRVGDEGDVDRPGRRGGGDGDLHGGGDRIRPLSSRAD